MFKLKDLVILSSILMMFSGGVNQANAQNQPVNPSTTRPMMQGCPMMMQNPNLPFDQRYLNMMIMHQQMGINMSQNALQSAQHPELKQMAQKVINENTSQIQQMQAWRKQWYGQ